MRSTEWIAVIAVEVLLGVSGLNHAEADEGAPLPQTTPSEPPRIPKPSELLDNSASLPKVPAVLPSPVPLPKSTPIPSPVAPGTTIYHRNGAWVWPSVAYAITPEPPPHTKVPWVLPAALPQTKIIPTGRTTIFFLPAALKVTTQLADGSFDTDVDLRSDWKEYRVPQSTVYRLRLKRALPDESVQTFYPTLEVAPATKKSAVFLQQSRVSISFTDDDFAQAKKGQLVVKVIYLPDPSEKDFSTIVDAEEINSTRLEAGVDPVAEAQKRGTILAIIRMGNIDLENRLSPVIEGKGTSVPRSDPVPRSDER